MGCLRSLCVREAEQCRSGLLRRLKDQGFTSFVQEGAMDDESKISKYSWEKKHTRVLFSRTFVLFE